MRYSTFLRYHKNIQKEINKTIRITKNQVAKYDANCNKNEYVCVRR